MTSRTLTSPNPATTLQRAPVFEIKGKKSMFFFFLFPKHQRFCLDIDLSIISKTFIFSGSESGGAKARVANFIQKEVKFIENRDPASAK